MYLAGCVSPVLSRFHVALFFPLQVADIKRVNNFLTEQDMYAVKTIRIPVKVHGIFTEQNKEPNAQTSRSADSPDVVAEPPDDGRDISEDPRDISQYFQEIDQNIEEATQTQELLGESYGSDGLQVAPLPRQKDSYLGADWGIRWWNAVLVMLLIGIVLPVFYIIYYEKASPFHSTNGTASQVNATKHFLKG